jgi:hypothetical protein
VNIIARLFTFLQRHFCQPPTLDTHLDTGVAFRLVHCCVDGAGADGCEQKALPLLWIIFAGNVLLLSDLQGGGAGPASLWQEGTDGKSQERPMGLGASQSHLLRATAITRHGRDSCGQGHPGILPRALETSSPPVSLAPKSLSPGLCPTSLPPLTLSPPSPRAKPPARPSSQTLRPPGHFLGL